MKRLPHVLVWSVLLILLLAVRGQADDSGQKTAERVEGRIEKAIGDASARLRGELLELIDEELATFHSAADGGIDGVLNSLTAAEAYRHVEFLAADALEGREAGEPGAAQAADYVRDHFRACGLEPVAGADGFFQTFKLPGRELAGTPALVRFDADDARREFALDRLDFVPFHFTGSGLVEAPLVFVGYGITAPEFGYDDYAGIDVKGKIVLCLRHEPCEAQAGKFFDGKRNTKHAFFEAKARRAAEAGAAGFLLVTDPNRHDGDLPLSAAAFLPATLTPALADALAALDDETLAAADLDRAALDEIVAHHRRTAAADVGIPCAHISLATAEALLATGLPDRASLAALQSRIDERHAPASSAVPGVRVALRVETVDAGRTTCNVIARLPGADPALRDEVVVLGAHFDHIGRNDAGEVWNGADDNASGTAALLQAARALAQARPRPARSIVFMAFGAEELGLIGSQFYVEHPLLPLARTVAMINLDMVGRGDKDLSELLVLGRATSPDLSRKLDEANQAVGLHLKEDHDLFENSDHFSFYAKGIPVLFLNSGLHKDYHQPTDEVQKIHPGKIRRTAQLVARLARSVADDPVRPAFRKLPESKAARPRLGVVPQEIDAAQRAALGVPDDCTAFELTQVTPGMPAEKAGLKAGDIITHIGGEPIPADNALGALLARLAAHPKGTPLAVTVHRAGTVLEVQVPMP